MIGVSGGGLLTALSGPSTAGADIGGLGTALATDVGPAAGAAALPAAEWARHRCRPRPAPERRSVECRCRPAGPGAAGIPAASTPVTLASQSWPPGTPGGCRPGRRAPWPECPRSPTAVVARLELRSPALRRQAQGHAGNHQADARLGPNRPALAGLPQAHSPATT